MNVILIGMPACGKSTLGVLLARALLLDFVDTDVLIQVKHGASLCDLIERLGLEGFKRAEEEALLSLSARGCVVATGGSAVYSAAGMAHLKQNGVAVYLRLPPEEIARRISDVKTRGIVMPEGSDIFSLYAERAPLYERAADITVDCAGLSTEQAAAAVIAALPPLKK